MAVNANFRIVETVPEQRLHAAARRAQQPNLKQTNYQRKSTIFVTKLFLYCHWLENSYANSACLPEKGIICVLFILHTHIAQEMECSIT